MLGIRLARLPLSAKIFCTLFLVGIGCGAIAAFTQAATAIGLSPADVQSSFAREMPMTSLAPSGAHGRHQMAEKEISLGDISSAASSLAELPGGDDPVLRRSLIGELQVAPPFVENA